MPVEYNYSKLTYPYSIHQKMTLSLFQNIVGLKTKYHQIEQSLKTVYFWTFKKVCSIVSISVREVYVSQEEDNVRLFCVIS